MTTRQDYFGKNQTNKFDAIVFAPQNFSLDYLIAVCNNQFLLESLEGIYIRFSTIRLE